MMDFFRELFSTKGFMPHGHCYMWEPGPFWLNVVADVLIAISYLTIPFGLLFFVRKRKDVDFRSLFYLFASFIFLCAITHILDVIGMWQPYYRLEGVMNLATGLVSATTAVVLWRIIPRALTIPHPRELEDARNQLMQQELARKQAEMASEVKSRFLADMSHEIRTPMSGVVMPLEVLMRLDLPPDAEEMVRVARSSSQRLVSLIDDLLDLSRIEADKLELHDEIFENETLLKNVAAPIIITAEQKGLDLLVELDETMPVQLKGDESRVAQILTNLLHNAVKFTASGSIKLRSEVIRKTGDIVEMCYSIEDTGIGIAEEDQARIFLPFSQQSGEISRQYGGTGLGLAISKKLAQLMAGDIKIQSEVGSGSKFIVTIPFAAPQPEELKAFQKKSRRLAEVDLLPSKHPSRILLLEDSEANVISTCAILQSKKHHVDVAHSLSEARLHLKNHSYRVVLLDLRLPDGSGSDLIAEIRQADAKRDPQRPHHTQIIIISAQALLEDQENAYAQGCDDYLTKPLTAEKLITTVESHLAKAPDPSNE